MQIGKLVTERRRAQFEFALAITYNPARVTSSPLAHGKRHTQHLLMEFNPLYLRFFSPRLIGSVKHTARSQKHDRFRI